MNPFNRKKVLVVSYRYLENKVHLPESGWEQVSPAEHDPYITNFSNYKAIILDIDDDPHQLRDGPPLSTYAVLDYKPRENRVLIATSAPEMDEKILVEMNSDWVRFPITEDKMKTLTTELSMN